MPNKKDIPTPKYKIGDVVVFNGNDYPYAIGIIEKCLVGDDFPRWDMFIDLDAVNPKVLYHICMFNIQSICGHDADPWEDVPESDIINKLN